MYVEVRIFLLAIHMFTFRPSPLSYACVNCSSITFFMLRNCEALINYKVSYLLEMNTCLICKHGDWMSHFDIGTGCELCELCKIETRVHDNRYKLSLWGRFMHGWLHVYLYIHWGVCLLKMLCGISQRLIQSYTVII